MILLKYDRFLNNFLSKSRGALNRLVSRMLKRLNSVMAKDEIFVFRVFF